MMEAIGPVGLVLFVALFVSLWVWIRIEQARNRRRRKRERITHR